MRLISMEYRDIRDIYKDLEEVDAIIFDMKKSLIDNPNNLGLKTNIFTLEHEKRDLIQELEYTNNMLGKTSFDIHISNNDGGKIELDNLSKVGGAIQDLINSCSMFDGFSLCFLILFSLIFLLYSLIGLFEVALFLFLIF